MSDDLQTVQPTADAPASEPTGPAASPSFVSRIVNVFVAPSRAFVGLSNKWEWLIAALIVIALGFGAREIQKPILIPELKAAAMENIKRFKDRMPADRYEEIVQRIDTQFEEGMSNSPRNIAIGLGAGLIFTVLLGLFCWMTGNFFLGGKQAFWAVLTVAAFCGFIGLVGDYLRTALMVMKDTSYVYIGLGMLKPQPDGSFLFYLLRQMEFVTMWKIAALSIGLASIYGKPAKRFALILTPLWLIFICLVAGANLYTGGTIVY